MEKKIRRGMRLTASFIQYFIIELAMIGYCSICQIITGPISGRLSMILIYVGIATLALYNSTLLWGVLALVLIVATTLALWMTTDNDNSQEGGKINE